jgi:hypothetical protein
MLMMRVASLVLAVFSLAAGASRAADHKAEHDKTIKASQDVGVPRNGLAGGHAADHSSQANSRRWMSTRRTNLMPAVIIRPHAVEYDHAAGILGSAAVDFPPGALPVSPGSSRLIHSTTPLCAASFLGKS